MKNNSGQGLKRKSSNQKLPPHVYKDRCRYYYRPYKGSLQGKPTYGKPIRLCALDASTGEIWKEYERIISGSKDTLKWLIIEYLESEKCKSLSPKTIDEYKNYSKIILCKKTTNNTTFGEIRLNNISQRTIRRYLDAYPHPVAANRHAQFLKAVFSWAMQRFEVVSMNPCIGVELNTEVARDRYIEDWEYEVVYATALSCRNPYFAAAMEIAYLSRARRGEVFSLTNADVRKDGLYIERSKKSESETTLWSPRLRDAYKLALSTRSGAEQAHLLFEDSAGEMHKKNALDSQWKRIVDKAKKQGAPLSEELKQEALDFRASPKENGNIALLEHFTFHDIKAKGISDHDTNHGGHKSSKMRGVYIRKGVKIKATR